MARSFVEFRYRGFWANDGNLQLWLSLIVQEIDKESAIPSWLTEVREWWRTLATVDFNGCMNPELDKSLTSADRVHLILGFAERALKRLDAYDDMTLDVYNQLTGENLSERDWGGDGPMDYLKRLGGKFIKLLRGEQDSDIWDTRG